MCSKTPPPPSQSKTSLNTLKCCHSTSDALVRKFVFCPLATKKRLGGGGEVPDDVRVAQAPQLRDLAQGRLLARGAEQRQGHELGDLGRSVDAILSPALCLS